MQLTLECSQIFQSGTGIPAIRPPKLVKQSDSHSPLSLSLHFLPTLCLITCNLWGVDEAESSISVVHCAAAVSLMILYVHANTWGRIATKCAFLIQIYLSESFQDGISSFTYLVPWQPKSFVTDSGF